MDRDRVPAPSRRLVFFAFALSTCYAPPQPTPQECHGHPARALCILEPEPGEEMRGVVTGEWEAECVDGRVFAPCERGVTCLESVENCSCECDPNFGNADCESMSLGMAAHGGPEGRSSECVPTETDKGRCVWGPT